MNDTEAELLFKKYGGYCFHMCREEPNEYERYFREWKSENKNSLEQQWRVDLFNKYANEINSISTDDIWHVYDRCYELADEINTPEVFKDLLVLSSSILNKIAPEYCHLVAETISGVRSNNPNAALVYRLFELGFVVEAKCLVQLGFDLIKKAKLVNPMDDALLNRLANVRRRLKELTEKVV